MQRKECPAEGGTPPQDRNDLSDAHRKSPSTPPQAFERARGASPLALYRGLRLLGWVRRCGGFFEAHCVTEKEPLGHFPSEHLAVAAILSTVSG